jgi:hypothetical protein
MNENSIDFESMNSSLVELKKENKKLLTQLTFAQKCVKLLENYRNYLIKFCNNCKCDQNIGNKLVLKELEIDYKNIFNSNLNISQKEAKNEITIGFDSAINCEQLVGHKNDNNFTENELILSTTEETDEKEIHLNDSLIAVKTENSFNMSFDVFPGNIDFSLDKSVNTSEQSSLNSCDGNATEDHFVFGKYNSEFENCFSVFKTKINCNSLLRQ